MGLIIMSELKLFANQKIVFEKKIKEIPLP